MKNILLITTLICLFAFKGNSQCQDQYFSSKVYPGICVHNAIKWLNMTRANWTKEMEKYDFNSTGYSEGTPYFSSGNAHWDLGVGLEIAKGFDKLEINNRSFTHSKKDIFQSIVGELEPFFNRNNGNWNFFVFKYTDDNVYEFAINQGSMVDLIFIKKL